MPVYNVAKFVNEAIDSMLAQTYTDFELIIIDDCSTDGTINIVDSYNDKRIHFIRKQKNTGLVDSLNIGLKQSKGEYIARMDGDDISHINRLEKQINFLKEQPEVVICGTAYELIESKNIVSYPTENEDIKIALLDYCPLGHPTVMFRKKFITDNALQYLEEYTCAEDYELWTRCIWLGKMANIPDVLLYYREHANQFSNTNKQSQLKNSALCRTSMLQKIWASASETDVYTREFLFQNEIFGTPKKLNDTVEWMDSLVTLNNQKGCYDPLKFSELILAKKSSAIRRFYLNQTKYNPKVLYNFLKSNTGYSAFFNTMERIKLGIKCIFFTRLSH